MKSHPKVTPKSPQSHPKVTPEVVENVANDLLQYECKYCNSSFKFKQGMYRHIKYSCTKSTDEDLQELVRLMNLQLEQQRTQIKKKDDMLYRQSKQIDKLMGKLQVNNITNNIVQNNNIQLLSYKDTDLSHLTETDYIQSLKKVTYCVKHLIEKIHFNPVKPENMNIYISNMKDKYLMVYDGGNWNLKNKSRELDDLYDRKEMILDDWLNRYQHLYPELRDKFNKYLNNKEHDETMNAIKDEIKIMMYNKKTDV